MSPSPQHEPPASAAQTYRQHTRSSGRRSTKQNQGPPARAISSSSSAHMTRVNQKRGPAAAKFAALTVNAQALSATIQRQYVLNHGPIIWVLKRILRYLLTHHDG